MLHGPDSDSDCKPENESALLGKTILKIYLVFNHPRLQMKRTVLPILLSGIWISLSEFIRNEFLFKDYWIDHYNSMGLTFPSEPLNGAVWGVWSLLFATFIYIIYKRFSLWETVGIAWLGGFVLMWIVTGNMAVLPFRILYFAIPLSLLEVYVAAWIIRKFTS